MATDEVTHTTLSAHVPIELARQVRAAAKATDTPPSRWITRALEQRLARLAASSSKQGGSGASEGVADDVHIDASADRSAGASAPRATGQSTRGAPRRPVSRPAPKDRPTSGVVPPELGRRTATPIPKGASK